MRQKIPVHLQMYIASTVHVQVQVLVEFICIITIATNYMHVNVIDCTGAYSAFTFTGCTNDQVLVHHECYRTLYTVHVHVCMYMYCMYKYTL